MGTLAVPLSKCATREASRLPHTHKRGGGRWVQPRPRGRALGGRQRIPRKGASAGIPWGTLAVPLSKCAAREASRFPHTNRSGGAQNSQIAKIWMSALASPYNAYAGKPAAWGIETRSHTHAHTHTNALPRSIIYNFCLGLPLRACNNANTCFTCL